jgi:integrase
LALPVTIRKRDRRGPFTVEQLGKIFGPHSPIYGGPEAERNGRFWVPLLSLWTGMHLNECCQLHVADVRYMKQVPVIVIEEGDDTDNKRVKTEAGERFVPVHPELEWIGFLEHWRAAERGGEVRLFPDLLISTDGYFSGPFSKWFRRYLKRPEVNAYSAKTPFHSLRHNYATRSGIRR